MQRLCRTCSSGLVAPPVSVACKCSVEIVGAPTSAGCTGACKSSVGAFAFCVRTCCVGLVATPASPRAFTACKCCVGILREGSPASIACSGFIEPGPFIGWLCCVALSVLFLTLTRHPQYSKQSAIEKWLPWHPSNKRILRMHSQLCHQKFFWPNALFLHCFWPNALQWNFFSKAPLLCIRMARPSSHSTVDSGGHSWQVEFETQTTCRKHKRQKNVYEFLLLLFLFSFCFQK